MQLQQALSYDSIALNICCLINLEVILMITEDPTFLHFGKFAAQSAALHTEVIGKLLTVIWDIKGIAASFFDAL